MDTIKNEIIEAAESYFKLMGETVSTDMIELLVNAYIDGYKNYRDYPDDYTDEMIDSDVARYIKRRKGDIAGQIIPEMVGKLGAEGVYNLSDNQAVRTFFSNKYYYDVTPICEVI